MDFITLADSLVASWFVISPLVLQLVIALFLLLVGLLVARGLEKVIVIVMKAIQLDKLSDQTGFDELLSKGNIKADASELLGSLVYWVTVLVAVVTVAGAMGLPVEYALPQLFAYMGVVFLAALILGLGVFLAGLIAGIIRVIMTNLGLEGAKILPRVVYYIVIIFSFLAALAELGFDPRALTPHIGIILGMPALAAAIAFGLGCKDMAADFLHNLFKGK
ncbi:MAG: hypothetical protein KJ732_07060 [Candidatus Margulisbacteria bacterium]|nr:hypothetical protein [Candidatus Margulisiibacteriota bacterium]